jgi:predicted AAA+ superfamily ATPase
MLETFKTIFYSLLEQTQFAQTRYLYPEINLKNRLLGIVGPRGVGKTTLMLQFIKNNLSDQLNQTLYFSADHLYFANHSLVEFVHRAYFDEKIIYFFIDEIHKYKNWDQALKNIYDSYPEARVVFSGSSSMDLIKGTYDLSRRAILKHLEGLSFREYLNFSTGSQHPALKPEDILLHYSDLDKQFLAIDQLRRHFKEYLERGYYPFILSDEEGYYQRINHIVDKTIYEDIANFYQLKTEHLHCLKRILSYLTTIPPGEVNTNNLAKNLSVDNKTAFHYLTILEEVGLVHLVYPQAKGNTMLRKVEKIFLNNTTLHYALNEQLSSPVEKGTVRELFFVQSLCNAGVEVLYSKQGDYIAMDTVFELGGKNKGRSQLRGTPGLLVKDDILASSQGMIPLYYWGFCY